MPITISLAPNNVDSSASNFVYAIATLTFSGSYPTGGDTLDFTQVTDKIPSTQNNWKLKAFSGGGTEITAGAYPASVTTDIVQLSITARKLF